MERKKRGKSGGKIEAVHTYVAWRVLLRVWSINHGVFPATGGHRGRWRGHIIGRIVPVCWSGGRHGHLSCRDRPAIDGSPRFELTPVKSRVARCHGKSCRAPLIDTGYYFPLVTRSPPSPLSPCFTSCFARIKARSGGSTRSDES